MRTKHLLALAVAGAFAVPASHAHDADQQGLVSGAPTEETHLSSSSPMQDTWYYPDGSVVYHEGNVYLMDIPGSEPTIVSFSDGSSASSGSSSSMNEEGASGDMRVLIEEPEVSDTWIIADAQPDVYLLIE